MKKYLADSYDNNWFFLSLVLFVIILPFSPALVSIFAGIIFIIALLEDSWKNKIQRVKKNWPLVFFAAIYLVYLIGGIFAENIKDCLYDLNKTLFFFIIPIAFLFGKTITKKQALIVLYSFCLAIIISTFVALINWLILKDTEVFSIHSVSLISHIRFSFQLILAFWFLIVMAIKNFNSFSKQILIVHFVTAIYFLSFLIFQQSLTGIISLISSILFFLTGTIFNTRNRMRYIGVVFLIFFFIAPILYVNNVIRSFYNFEKVDINSIDKKTKQGNLYWHNFKDKSVENGHFVGLYLCNSELKAEWNKRSEIKYDSINSNGYPVSATLKRYLTSKGLRKDAEGVKKLSEADIRNVENCVSNVIFQKKKYSLYPRIYQTVWEYYTYTTTGNSNNQSFSQRIEFAKAAISIIKDNVWFGVGPGNWKAKFSQAFKRNNSQLNERFYASSHNQYLNYLVKFGVVGFLFIMFFLIYPIVKTKSYRNILFLLFLVFMFFANFADSNFESHMGSSFFVFFYCFFLIQENNFLQINK